MNDYSYNSGDKMINSTDKLANFFKIFGDITRINILKILISDSKSVMEIANTLNMTHSSISHQLQILRKNNLVKTKKIKTTVYYSLADDHIKKILKIGEEHVCE